MIGYFYNYNPDPKGSRNTGAKISNQRNWQGAYCPFTSLPMSAPITLDKAMPQVSHMPFGGHPPRIRSNRDACAQIYNSIRSYVWPSGYLGRSAVPIKGPFSRLLISLLTLSFSKSAVTLFWAVHRVL